jgi:hypothetical protein
MRERTMRATLVMLALVAALYLPTQRAGAAAVEPFDIEKAVTGATTPADHEAIASYYDREATTAKRVMNSFTYMRSQADCAWKIAVQRASVRRRGKTRSVRVRSDVWISQDLPRSNTVGYNPHL